MMTGVSVVWFLNPQKLNLESINRNVILNLSEETKVLETAKYPCVVTAIKNNSRVVAQDGVFVYFPQESCELEGIICLQSTLAWGFVAVFIFGFLNKFVERFVFSIDYRIASVMAMILVFSYTADFMQSFSESLNMQNMDIRAEMRKFIKMFHR